MALRDLIIHRPARKMVDQKSLIELVDGLIANAPKSAPKDYSFEAGFDRGYAAALKAVRRKLKARTSKDADHG